MADESQNERTERQHGPYPEPRGHDRPWEATETERGPFERRAGPDLRGTESATEETAEASTQEATEAAASDDTGSSTPQDGRRRWGRRKSDVLSTEGRETLTARSRSLARRFREPIIGLTLAGVAAPLINAGMNPSEAEAKPERKQAGAAAEEPAAAERDLEEEVGDYWADAEEDVVRDHTIEGAMTRWDINRPLAQKIYDYATKHDIEPEVAYGLVFTESTFRERAVSHVGARGLTQLMPRTAQWLEPGVAMRDLYDPDVNLDIGFRYLRQLIDKYEGDVENALTAYNRGPGTVDRILGRGGNPDNGYAGKVLAG